MVDVLSRPRYDGFPSKCKRPRVSAIRDYPRDCGMSVPKLERKRGREEFANVQVAADSRRVLRKYPSPKLRKGVPVTRDFPALPNAPAALRSQMPSDFKVPVVDCRQSDASNATDVHAGMDAYACNDVKEFSLSMVVEDEKCQVGISTATNASMDLKESSPSMLVDNEQSQVVLCGVNDYQEVRKDQESDKVPSIARQESLSMVVSDEQYLDVLFEEHDYQTAFSDEKCEKDLLVMNNSQTVVNNNLVIADKMAWEKVKEVIHLYREVYLELSQDKKGRKEKGSIHVEAALILQSQQKWINKDRRLGPIPGVNVGDCFDRRAELNIIGLHRQFFTGIDYMKLDGRILATSIVDSGRYDNIVELNDEQEFPEVLIYSGQGENSKVASKKTVDDQKLLRGNLALKNSADAKTPIRVLRKVIFKGARRKNDDYKFVYDGLYFVDSYREERALSGKLVFKFVLKRFPGQPKLGEELVCRKDISQGKEKVKREELVCRKDISQGKEKIPIRAMNALDDEKPPFFDYVTNVSYPESYHPPMPSESCDCIDGCSDSDDCPCAIKNGGEIPYNYEECIMMAKPLIVECGPSCKCFTSCINRVSQRGIRFPLEVFKTKRKGWGVRSRSFIPRGSFICEYTGKILRDKEVEKSIGRDEYLFDIGNNYGNHSLRDIGILPSADLHSSDVNECFTIDAAQFGNVGRFINHSCSPNLFAQNVLFDHNNKSMPHIMLFAMEDIPSFEELTYDYNYKIGDVCDVNGNIKVKTCHCGSEECTGRMY